ncbi:STAS domain-containing protein [Rhizobium sp. SG2393]|uniref:STAS domain-containing protein n=1 Tax=Rhizobium sp. SG2393 TaxID=3276279 RepID=UPI003671B0DA
MSSPGLTHTAPGALPSHLTIRHAAAAHDALRQAFEAEGPIVLSVPEGAEIDLSFLQLVEAARKQADAFHRPISLDRPATGNLLATLERAGFLTEANARDTEFWLHRKD